MGMAPVETYPRPKVTKRYGKWRVTWCEPNNTLWYREFWSWQDAVMWTK